MKRFFILVSLLFSLRPVRAAAAQSAEAVKPEPFRVGVIQSLTGIAAEDGKTAVRALELAKDEINSGAGPKVELLVEDDGTDSVKAVEAFKKLQLQGITALIGPTWSFTGNAVLPLAGREKIVLFNTSTIPECLKFETADGFGYSTATKTIEHARVLGDYLARTPMGTAIIFYTNNTWGEAQRADFLPILKDKGVNVLREVPSAVHDTNDWRSMLPQLKALNADLWVLLLNKADLDTVIRRAREISVPAKLFASYHFADTLRIAQDKQLFNGVCYSYPNQQTPAEREFMKKFHERYNENPRVFADTSYDTLFLLYEAFKNSKKNSVSLKAALVRTTLKGVVGDYKLDEKSSFSLGKVSLMCVKNGAAVHAE